MQQQGVNTILGDYSSSEWASSRVDETVAYFHELAFQADPKVVFPPFLEGNERALALRDVLLQIRAVLTMTRSGNFDYDIEAKGFLGGLLEALQSNVRHITWLANRIAEGDLTQRMDSLGEFANAFNRMTEQLAQMTSQLRTEKERWRLALECSKDGVFEIVMDARDKMFCSPSLAAMQHIDLEDLPPVERWIKFIHPEDTKARHILKDILDGTYIKDTYDAVFRLRCADGVYRWRQSRGQVFRNADNRITRTIGILEDIHNRKEREDDFRRRATHDSLTGLPNKSLFLQHLRQMMASASRAGKVVLVVMADLDHFKDVNDTWGHHAGDLLLQEFANRLRSCIRKSDIAARLGGDEFALLLVCDPVPSNHVAAIRRIEAALEAPVGLESTSYRIRASLGIAVYPQDGNESLFLLKRADDALYRAKRSGRNTYCFYTSSKPPSS